MSLAFVAPVATHIFGVSYSAGDPVDVSGWSARAVQQALSRGWIVTAGGGSSPGAPVVRKFPFAFDTPDLTTGHAIYTPTAGDVLLDAWIYLTTAWDGTTPLGEIFIHGFGGEADYVGAYYWLGPPINTVTAQSCVAMDAGNAYGAQPLSQMSVLGNVQKLLKLAGLPPGDETLRADTTVNYPTTSNSDTLPWTLTTDPIKMCVSQDGTNTGADPGATQGAAILYLMTCTPA